MYLCIWIYEFLNFCKETLLFKLISLGCLGSSSQLSIWLSLSVQVMRLSPSIGLLTQQRVCFKFSLSLSLSPLPSTRVLSLKEINILKKSVSSSECHICEPFCLFEADLSMSHRRRRYYWSLRFKESYWALKCHCIVSLALV